MVGGTVCRVERSLHPDFAPGDWVLANTGWQDYAVSSGQGLIPLGQQLEQAPDTFIGLLDGKNFGKLAVRVGEESAPIPG